MIFLFITLAYGSFLELYYKCDTGMCVGTDIFTEIAIDNLFIYLFIYFMDILPNNICI